MTRAIHPDRAIFIVDDEECDRMIIEAVLARSALGNEVICCDSGEALLGQLAQRSVVPALILVDLNMAGMSGFEVVRRVRALERYADVPIALLTSSDSERDRARALELGASDFVPKQSGLRAFVELFDRRFRPARPTDRPTGSVSVRPAS